METLQQQKTPQKASYGSRSSDRSAALSYPSRTVVHAKLEMTGPGDYDELEADAVANDIVSGGKIRRQISNGGGSGIAVSPQMERQIAQLQGGGHAMPDGLRNMMENGFGRNFSQVRLHTDSQAADMSSSLHAKAFTHGNDIYFNRGQFSPNTSEGQRLLAHELTHVAQGGNNTLKRQSNNEKPKEETPDDANAEKILNPFVRNLCDVASDVDSIISGILSGNSLKYEAVQKLFESVEKNKEILYEAVQKLFESVEKNKEILNEGANQFGGWHGKHAKGINLGIDIVDAIASIYCIYSNIEKICHDLDLISKGNNEYYAQLTLDIFTLSTDILTFPWLEKQLVKVMPHVILVAESLSAGLYLGDLIRKTPVADYLDERAAKNANLLGGADSAMGTIGFFLSYLPITGTVLTKTTDYFLNNK